MNDRPDAIDGPGISIIIPTLNEGANIPAVLESTADPRVVECIVVDGGSDDDTVALARGLGAAVIETGPGRARQLNIGAATAQGRVLLFLHGDTRLPAGFGDEIERVLGDERVVAGAFRLRLDADGIAHRLIERGVVLRSRCYQLPYGDQALFMGRDTFGRVGGFPEQPLMEDFEMVRSLQRLGRIGLAWTSVTTSARRWRKLGPVRTTAVNQLVVLGYWLGIEPSRLAAFYRSRR